MRFVNQGLSLWYATPDAPAPEGAVPAGVEELVTVGLSPPDGSNWVDVHFRVNGGAVDTVPARWFRNDHVRGAQYFTARLPPFEAGDKVEFWVTAACAGRYVPARDVAGTAVMRLRVGESVIDVVAPQPPASMHPSTPQREMAPSSADVGQRQGGAAHLAGSLQTLAERSRHAARGGENQSDALAGTGACRPVGEWPELLLGPMVRRVTRDMVSVFIATSIKCDAHLAVRPGRLKYNEIDDVDFGTISSSAVALDQLGTRLWVGLIQAWLPSDSSPGQLFSYDIKLITPSAEELRLNQLGELGRGADLIRVAVPLGYETDMLPSFVVPPTDVGFLRLAHASCRKPHGGTDAEPDALRILDEVIALSLGISAPMPADDEWPEAPEAPPASNRERPHQLILTGDQIYADDVAPGLLAALTEAAGELLGWSEELPGVVSGVNDFMVWPGWRTRFLDMAGIVDIPAIGDEDFSASHLLRFGEWCAMYLFAWSDALWARTSDQLGVQLPDAGSRLPLAEFTKWFGKIPEKNIPPQFAKWVDVAGLLVEFDEQIAEVWEDTLDQAMRYGATVRIIRRLLANVATYTMFDDHEITDDWFLNRDVTDRLLGVDDSVWIPDLGPRVLRNGLSAYAIFQHWGNVPTDFGSYPGTQRDWRAWGDQLPMPLS